MAIQKVNKIHIFLFLQIIAIGCSVPNLVNRGEVIPSNFYTKINFATAKSLILIPCAFEGETKNFIFDTGATVTAIQRDSTIGKTITVRGASNRTTQNGSEILESFKINDVNFTNTFATNENMIGLKEQIENFGGILGRSIINKANWLIDYPARTLEISNKNLSDDSFLDIELNKQDDAPHTWIEINGKKYDAIIDLGSISTLNIPWETELAKDLLAVYDFEDYTRERYTVGGLETITEKIGVVPMMKIGNMEFKDVSVNLNRSSQIRLGMSFFKNSIIYIDNSNRRYRIKGSE